MHTINKNLQHELYLADNIVAEFHKLYPKTLNMKNHLLKKSILTTEYINEYENAIDILICNNFLEPEQDPKRANSTRLLLTKEGLKNIRQFGSFSHYLEEKGISENNQKMTKEKSKGKMMKPEVILKIISGITSILFKILSFVYR